MLSQSTSKWRSPSLHTCMQSHVTHTLRIHNEHFHPRSQSICFCRENHHAWPQILWIYKQHVHPWSNPHDFIVYRPDDYNHVRLAMRNFTELIFPVLPLPNNGPISISKHQQVHVFTRGRSRSGVWESIGLQNGWLFCSEQNERILRPLPQTILRPLWEHLGTNVKLRHTLGDTVLGRLAQRRANDVKVTPKASWRLFFLTGAIF